MLAIRENSKRSQSNHPHESTALAHRSPNHHGLDDFFSGFGAPAMLSENPFASMERMMNRMSNMAQEMFSGFGDFGSLRSGFPHSDHSGGSYYSSTIVQSSKFDRNGQPVVQKYRSEAKGSRNERGEMIRERKQAYANTETGLEKYGHERMIGDKGRKVVKEKMGEYERTSDVYRNMNERDANDFDRHWNSNWGGPALPGPSGNIYGRHYEERKIDEGRRGDYSPNNWRGENQPVRRTDIQPTVPAPRQQALPAPARRVVQRNNPPRRTPAPGA